MVLPGAASAILRAKLIASPAPQFFLSKWSGSTAGAHFMSFVNFKMRSFGTALDAVSVPRPDMLDCPMSRYTS